MIAAIRKWFRRRFDRYDWYWDLPTRCYHCGRWFSRHAFWNPWGPESGPGLCCSQECCEAVSRSLPSKESGQALSSALTHHPNRERMDLMKLKTFARGVGAAVLATALMGATCTKPVVVGPTPPADAGPSFVNCSESALHQAALNILPNVETALASSSWEAALASLIAGIGGPLAFAEVACAVQWVEAKAEQNAAMAAADPVEVLKEAHAKAWLAAHPVVFQ